MRNLIIILFAFTLLSTGKAQGQHAIFTLSCDSMMSDCDTTLAEYYNKKNQLIRKIKYEQEKTIILYEYDSLGNLTGKKHRKENWELIKYERYTLNERGKWYIDSIFGKSNELLLTLLRKPSDQPDLYYINWFFRNEETPMTVQKIQEDERGNELSNSTCYAVDNCVTYLYRYHQLRKTGVELWVLGPDNFGAPRLTETEELIYNEQGQLTGRVRFSEPDHKVMERNKYIRVEGAVPVRKN